MGRSREVSWGLAATLGDDIVESLARGGRLSKGGILLKSTRILNRGRMSESARMSKRRRMSKRDRMLKRERMMRSRKSAKYRRVRIQLYHPLVPTSFKAELITRCRARGHLPQRATQFHGMDASNEK